MVAVSQAAIPRGPAVSMPVSRTSPPTGGQTVAAFQYRLDEAPQYIITSQPWNSLSATPPCSERPGSVTGGDQVVPSKLLQYMLLLVVASFGPWNTVHSDPLYAASAMEPVH